MKIFQINNITCKLGQSATENWSLLDQAKPEYIFFHLSSFPSGYVILECTEEPNENILTEAAIICKNGTKYRNLKYLKVDYCRCDNLSKGDIVGMVKFKSMRKVKKILTS